MTFDCESHMQCIMFHTMHLLLFMYMKGLIVW